MPQLNFVQNFNYVPSALASMNNNTLSFFPFNVLDSISFSALQFNFFLSCTTLNPAAAFSVGLYSLNGSTLSLRNSISGTMTVTQNFGNAHYVSITNTSATQNITPGTWFFGFLISTSDAPANAASFLAGSSVNPANAFLGGFIGGRMTASTAALPASYATSDLDVTGNDAMWAPYILLTA